MESALLAEELGHMKNHVTYPANKSQVIAACNNMSHLNVANRDWIANNLPEGSYKGPSDILNALLTKV